MTTKKWSDCISRLDLMLIPILEEHNWTPNFHYADIINKRTNPNNPPLNPVSFKIIVNQRNVVALWRTRDNWTYALSVNGAYLGHKKLTNVLDIIDVNLNKFVEDNNII